MSGWPLLTARLLLRVYHKTLICQHPRTNNENENENLGSDEDGEEIDQRGTEERNNSSNKAARRKSSDRPGVQERVGKTESRLREDSSHGRRHADLRDCEIFSDDKNHITPKELSKLLKY